MDDQSCFFPWINHAIGNRHDSCFVTTASKMISWGESNMAFACAWANSCARRCRHHGRCHRWTRFSTASQISGQRIWGVPKFRPGRCIDLREGTNYILWLQLRNRRGWVFRLAALPERVVFRLSHFSHATLSSATSCGCRRPWAKTL